MGTGGFKMAIYPKTPITDDTMTFKEGVIPFLRVWVKQEAKPLRLGAYSLQRSIDVFNCYIQLHAFMCASYGLKTTIEMQIQSINKDTWGKPLSSGSSYYDSHRKVIVLCGSLSLITYLHEFAHARGWDEIKAVRWSLSLFKRCFPKMFAALGDYQHCKKRKVE